MLLYLIILHSFQFLASYGDQLQSVTSCAVRNETHAVPIRPACLSIVLHSHTRNLHHRFVSYNCKTPWFLFKMQ